ncbi:hypothetical protein [Streptosporangium sp. NBC_01756]|nr:hypothetical protein [Streptosporangium sp. NBC_01756]WSC84280.1 hypothetical protein OIE48_28345 [Streptosporangium sp. NBC_01756]
MGLNILIVIVASMVFGFILGVITARPRRWDLYVCADDTIHVDTASDRDG